MSEKSRGHREVRLPRSPIGGFFWRPYAHLQFGDRYGRQKKMSPESRLLNMSQLSAMGIPWDECEGQRTPGSMFPEIAI